MAEAARAAALDLPEVTILMGLHNGARYLPAQLASIARQKGVRWRLVMADDASHDETRAIAAAYMHRHAGRATLINGPARGHVANYLSMLAGLSAAPGYVALSDQDDVWFADKLRRAFDALAAETEPTLYCSAAIITAHRVTRRFRRAPSFRNALVQNIAAGHSIVLNPAAACLARNAARDLARVGLTEAPASHDWFLYQLITGAGGRVIYDPAPTLLYRQHATNMIGVNRGLAATFRRARALASGQLRDWGRANDAALSALEKFLRPEHRIALRNRAALSDASLRARLKALLCLRPYRQSLTGTALLWITALFGRV